MGNQDWLAQLQGQLGLQGQGLSNAGSLSAIRRINRLPLNPSLFSDITSGMSAVAPFASG